MLQGQDILTLIPFILTNGEKDLYWYGITALEVGSLVTKAALDVKVPRGCENFEEFKIVVNDDKLGS